MTRQLRESDADAYLALRQEALTNAPLAFASSPGDDRASSVEAVQQMLCKDPDSVVIGAFEARLVGAVGLYRDRHIKAAHKAHLWGMYVTPSARGRGIGERLLAAVIAHARSMPGVEWVYLSVSEAAPEARRLYERAGFTVWGTEPDALRHEGRSVVEDHMAKKL